MNSTAATDSDREVEEIVDDSNSSDSASDVDDCAGLPHLYDLGDGTDNHQVSNNTWYSCSRTPCPHRLTGPVTTNWPVFFPAVECSLSSVASVALPPSCPPTPEAEQPAATAPAEFNPPEEETTPYFPPETPPLQSRPTLLDIS